MWVSENRGTLFGGSLFERDSILFRVSMGVPLFWEMPIVRTQTLKRVKHFRTAQRLLHVVGQAVNEAADRLLVKEPARAFARMPAIVVSIACFYLFFAAFFTAGFRV